MNTHVKTMIAVVAGVAVVALFFWFGIPNPSTTPSTESQSAAVQSADSTLGTVTVPADAFVESPSGLKTADVSVGTGQTVADGQTVTIHYVGKFSNGTKFDSSLDRGQPFSFVLGAHQVIPGMEQGLQGMRVGGVRHIIIPSPLAYGSSGVKGKDGQYIIPPDTALEFDVQVVSIGTTTSQ